MTNPTPATTQQDTPERIAARKRIAAYMQLIHSEYEFLGEKPKVVGLCGGCQKMRLVDKRAA
jgi:hypothetical protein